MMKRASRCVSRKRASVSSFSYSLNTLRSARSDQITPLLSLHIASQKEPSWKLSRLFSSSHVACTSWSQDDIPKVHNFEAAKADVEFLMSEGHLDKAAKFVYEVLDWLAKQKKQRPDLAPRYFENTIEALTILATIFGRRQNFSEALQCIQKAIRMRSNSLGFYKESLTVPGSAQSASQRDKTKTQVKNLLESAGTICVFARLLLQYYEKLKLENSDWEIKDESSSMLQSVEKEIKAAKEILGAELFNAFLTSYAGDTQQVMSPFSLMLVSPTVLMLETRQRLLHLSVEADLLLARVHQLRKNFVEAQKVLQGCLTNVEKELGSLAVDSPFLAATFTGIAESRLSLFIQGEAAQFGSSALWSQDETKEGEGLAEQEAKGDSAAANLPKLTFAAKEEYLEEVDALLQKCVNIFQEQREVSPFPEYDAHSLYLRGKLLALRSEMSMEAVETFSLLLPDNERIPVAKRDQIASQRAQKIQKLAENTKTYRKEAEIMLRKAYNAKKKLYGTHFHHEVTECLAPLVSLLSSQPERLKETYIVAAEAFEHLDYLPSNSSITAELLDALADVKESDSDYGKAEEFRKRAVEVRKATHGASHPLTLAAHHKLCNLYIQQHRWEIAERSLVSLAKVWKKRLNKGVPVHNILADLVHEIALLQSYQDKNDEAEKHLKYALRIAGSDTFAEEFFHKRITTGTLDTTLGWFLYNKEEMDKAVPHLKNSAEVLEKKYQIMKKLPKDVRQLIDSIRTERRGRMEKQQKKKPFVPQTIPPAGEGEEEEDEEEALTGLSKEDRALMSEQMKEGMKETIEAAKKAVLEEQKAEQDPSSLAVDEEELLEPMWGSVEESLIDTLHALVDISLLMGDQPHLFEGYAKKAVEIAEEVYPYIENPSLPKPDNTNGEVTAAAQTLSSQLLSYATVLQLLDRMTESQFFVSRATAITSSYKLDLGVGHSNQNLDNK